MHIISRNIVLIKAKQPFLDWLNQTPFSIPIALEDVNQDCTAILVPDFESVGELSLYLEQLKPAWFELVLDTWKSDRAVWPQARDNALFDQWFELEIHSTVWDNTAVMSANLSPAPPIYASH